MSYTSGLEEAVRLILEHATLCEKARTKPERPHETLRHIATILQHRCDDEPTDPLNMSTCAHCGATSVFKYEPPRG
jgi:hypothetical protein